LAPDGLLKEQPAASGWQKWLQVVLRLVQLLHLAAHGQCEGPSSAVDILTDSREGTFDLPAYRYCTCKLYSLCATTATDPWDVHELKRPGASTTIKPATVSLTESAAVVLK